MEESASEVSFPALTIPPRPSLESFFNTSSFSPGPVSLVSSFLAEQSPSFSKLLAEEECSGDPEGSQKPSGYKQNRPVNLELAQSPLFMNPSSLSPSVFLNSPGFLSPLQIKEHLVTGSDNKPLDELGKHFEQPEVSQSENKTSLVTLDKPACDGYNWRKYGQKKVKASECPRSYYKCTHSNCSVKKKVERSIDGHITEITYNGRHNHVQPTKQRKDGSALDSTDFSGVRRDISTHEWTVMNSSDGSSTQMTSELLVERECDEIISNLIDVEERHDEPDAKRTKTAAETVALPHVTVADSKIVLQTRSEVDLLDDGYKWRKYGQKVVKGTQHPRSYYRCTYSGCNVRKQVERASTDPKAVITTYEGKHNHDIPTVVRNRRTRYT